MTPLPWVARTATHRLVLPLLQNRHWPHSAVYSGMTWSPGLTDVTPSPTSTTMPAPSWPSTAGNTPSGSSPDRVKASVWHSAVWVIFTSTSPALGGATSISTICSGWPAAKATAARDFMGKLLGTATKVGPPAMPAAGDSLEVGTHQRGDLGDPLLALVGRAGGLAEGLADVRFHDLGHQAIDRAADGGDLLQHRRAVRTGLQRALERLGLAADAAHPGQHALLFLGTVRHASDLAADTAGWNQPPPDRAHAAPSPKARLRMADTLPVPCNPPRDPPLRYRTVPIVQLRPGMYVQRVNGAWLKHPFW